MYAPFESGPGLTTDGSTSVVFGNHSTSDRQMGKGGTPSTFFVDDSVTFFSSLGAVTIVSFS